MTCVICDGMLEPSPTEDGWMSLGAGKGIHDRCIEHIWTAYMRQPATMDLHTRIKILESKNRKLEHALEVIADSDDYHDCSLTHSQLIEYAKEALT